MLDAQHANIKPHSYYEQPHAYYTAQGVQEQAILLMHECDGWCSDHKGAFLVSLILDARPENVVEIGVYGGKSLVPMAYALKALEKGKIYGIDPWSCSESVKEIRDESNIDFWGHLDHSLIKNALVATIEKFELDSQIELIQSTSEEADPIYNIGLLHIDGNHSEAMSYLDVTKWVPLVCSGGYIVLDDMTWCEKGMFTTARAAQWLDKNCIKFTEFTDNSKWGVWVKP